MTYLVKVPPEAGIGGSSNTHGRLTTDPCKPLSAQVPLPVLCTHVALTPCLATL